MNIRDRKKWVRPDDSFVGIYQDANRNWRFCATFSTQRIGWFDSPEDAKAARNTFIQQNGRPVKARPARSSTGFVGVYPLRHCRRFCAFVSNTYVGSFGSPEEARDARAAYIAVRSQVE